MNEEDFDTIRDVMARVFALQAALGAVIATHPNPAALRLALDREEDAGMANMLYRWPDQPLDLYRECVQSLRSRIQPQ